MPESTPDPVRILINDLTPEELEVPEIQAAPSLIDVQFPKPKRRSLTTNQSATVHHVMINNQPCVIVASTWDDGTLAEVLISCPQLHSSGQAMLNTWCRSISLAIQSTIPLDLVINEFKKTSGEPSGATDNPAIPYAYSIIDYCVRWLEKAFTVLD